MTKAHERGENEFTRAAKLEAMHTKRDVCDILKEWLKAAKIDKDTQRQGRIIKAQKTLKCRNVRKRRSKP
jgi:hypothetical protein